MNLLKATTQSLTLSFFLTLSTLAFASTEKVLVTVSSDLDNEVAKLIYVMDEETREMTHLYQDRFKNNQRIERVEMNLESVNGKGVILHKKDKYVTVRLYSHNFDTQRGGILYLDTLYSGLSGERREYEIEVTMDGEETVMRNNKKAFSKMFFKAKKAPIVGAVGIEKVLFTP